MVWIVVLPLCSCTGADRQRRKFAVEVFIMGGDGDHSRIVRTIFEWRKKGFPPLPSAGVLQRFPQAAVGGYAAGDANIRDARFTGRFFQLVQQDGDDSPQDA